MAYPANNAVFLGARPRRPPLRGRGANARRNSAPPSKKAFVRHAASNFNTGPSMKVTHVKITVSSHALA